MSSRFDEVLTVVIATIRQTIAEDWIADFPIDADSRFNQDLEIESIEFVRIADALQRHYGQQLNIAGWLSGRTIHELIGLSTGELARHITASLDTGVAA